jgi:hypothetical protein
LTNFSYSGAATGSGASFGGSVSKLYLSGLLLIYYFCFSQNNPSVLCHICFDRVRHCDLLIIFKSFMACLVAPSKPSFLWCYCRKIHGQNPELLGANRSSLKSWSWWDLFLLSNKYGWTTWNIGLPLLDSLKMIFAIRLMSWNVDTILRALDGLCIVSVRCELFH